MARLKTSVVLRERKRLGAGLRRWRLRLGLTQVQLAMKAGIRTADITDAENGKQNFSIDRLYRIRRALGDRRELFP